LTASSTKVSKQIKFITEKRYFAVVKYCSLAKILNLVIGCGYNVIKTKHDVLQLTYY